ARAGLLAAATALDDAANANQPIGEDLRGPLRASMCFAGEVARDVVAAMYQLGSSSSVYQGGALERLFRDTNAASQHVLLHTTHYEPAGRVLFGRPAGVPIL